MSEMWWTASELKEAITRCEADCEAMIANGATPEQLYCRRAGIQTLYDMLSEVERNERKIVSYGENYHHES